MNDLTMTLTIALTPEELHLLRTALQVWHYALSPTTDPYMTARQHMAGKFTQRRIDEMLARLEDQPTGADE